MKQIPECFATTPIVYAVVKDRLTFADDDGEKYQNII